MLPVETITPEQIPTVYTQGDRHKVYKCVMSIPDMYRLKAGGEIQQAEFLAMSDDAQYALYFEQPGLFESNLEQVLPYTTLLMNCVLWSPKFPRLVTNDLMLATWQHSQALKVIGDISCDPDGAIQFSRETWVDAPVYIYHPEKGDLGNGLDGEGIAVMAVTNLPCAFSADASAQFTRDLAHLLPSIGDADYDAKLDESGLPDEVRKAVILWQGEFTPKYQYMREFLPS